MSRAGNLSPHRSCITLRTPIRPELEAPGFLSARHLIQPPTRPCHGEGRASLGFRLSRRSNTSHEWKARAAASSSDLASHPHGKAYLYFAPYTLPLRMIRRISTVLSHALLSPRLCIGRARSEPREWKILFLDRKGPTRPLLGLKSRCLLFWARRHTLMWLIVHRGLATS